MIQAIPTLALKEFLAQPNIDASPAWELMNGQAHQKPMPSLFHSRLQRNLVNWVNDHTETFEAIQELRCLIPPQAPVPAIVVIACDRLSDQDGPFQGAPDWLIEIRSPDWSGHWEGRPAARASPPNVQIFLSQGTRLAWLIDLARQQVWVWDGDNLPLIYTHADRLPTLEGFPELTVAALMAMTQGKGSERGL